MFLWLDLFPVSEWAVVGFVALSLRVSLSA
jgi:hypothetical protein